MRVDQFFKLRDADLDDMLEVYCIMNDITDEQRNVLLTKSFKKLQKLCAKIDLSDMDVSKLTKPMFVKIGRWLYKVPADFSDLEYGQYLQIGEIVADLHENHKDDLQEHTLTVIPKVVSIVFKCKEEDVLKANANKIFPIGAFFLSSISDFTKLKAKLREQSLTPMQFKPEYLDSTNTSTTTKL